MLVCYTSLSGSKEYIVRRNLNENVTFGLVYWTITNIVLNISSVSLESKFSINSLIRYLFCRFSLGLFNLPSLPVIDEREKEIASPVLYKTATGQSSQWLKVNKNNLY